ncbi:3,4-dihydroxy-2-butanone 4-phosphate synthase [Ignicoccus islandicus DSM 13165]|uniref:3,4-dihydroxy-2-butanone 4-phosphate synthase n=1 Tax=Ignicoccus islandicus DSM 13165 TaxID=940295 RepID=A0A0U2M9X1_9CREN|nr:3,4-dihydroxy-2-butanone-4-phosphate synthase [Ignicoccus islandicus]ALU11885.1 3,4-dihydroxy-2-butanone 4-phosphate synthase [Ignicoccus islandicus DSM 13165]
MDLREHLLSGKPIMIYDSESRENEVDLVFYSGAVSRSSIYALRSLAGGLICFSMPLEIGSQLGLDYMHNYLKELGFASLVRPQSYGDYPAFSISVNHQSVGTGISDEDRAKTVRELFEVVKLALEDPSEARKKFLNEFQAPGHVPILLARNLDERQGHTELSTRLFQSLGLVPSAVFAEVLDYGHSMRLDKAREISKTLGIPLLSSNEIIEMVRGR